VNRITEKEKGEEEGVVEEDDGEFRSFAKCSHNH
jgi:hypothetical protein